MTCVLLGALGGVVVVGLVIAAVTIIRTGVW